MNPYDPPPETPASLRKPLKYRPRFGPGLGSLLFGLVVFFVANVIGLKQGNLGDWFWFNCLIGAGAVLLASAIEIRSPNRKD